MRNTSMIYVRVSGQGPRIWNAAHNLRPVKAPNGIQNHIRVKATRGEKIALPVETVRSDKNIPLPSFLFMGEKIQTELLISLSLWREVTISAHLPTKKQHVSKYDLQISPSLNKYRRSAVSLPFVIDSNGKSSFDGKEPETVLSTISFIKIIKDIARTRKSHLALSMLESHNNFPITLRPRAENLGLMFLPERKMELFSKNTLEYLSLLYALYPKSVTAENLKLLTDLFESAHGPLAFSTRIHQVGLAVGYDPTGTIVGNIII